MITADHLSSLSDVAGEAGLGERVLTSEAAVLELLVGDVGNARSSCRHLLAPTWSPERSAVVTAAVLDADEMDEALRRFEAASAYLWSTGSVPAWNQLVSELERRFDLDDLGRVVAAAVRAPDPEGLGHWACTRVYLDQVNGVGSVDAELLVPLTRLASRHYAGYRASRRLAICRSFTGRTDIGRLLDSNRLVAAATRNAHDAAEVIGDTAFLCRDFIGAADSIELIRFALGRRQAADGCRTAGQAQLVVASALLGDQHVTIDFAGAFAASVGARHLLPVLARSTTSPTAALQDLARIW